MNIRTLANDLLENLRAGCERIEIAGSIRRGKADPKDIEIVAVPIIKGEDLTDMFGTVVDRAERSLLDWRIDIVTFELHGGWEFDTVVRRNGPKYKRLSHLETGICCDLFITTPGQWGNIFAIRTGPGDFSQALVTRARDMGLKQDGGKLWKLHRDDTRTVIPCPEERDFFAALNVAWLEPHERTVAAIRAPGQPAAVTAPELHGQ